MDTSLDTYRELKRETDTFISSFKKKHYEQFKEKYGVFPDEWVPDQDDLIKTISICPPEECRGVWKNSELAIDHILNIKQDADKILIQYDWSILHLWAKDENYKQIEIECKGSGKMGLILGYGLLFRLSAERFYLYLEEHGTKDPIYLRFSKLFEDDPALLEQSEIAHENIRKFSLNTFKKRRETKDVDSLLLEDVNKIIWGKTQSRISEDVEESLLLAAKGDLKIKYLPNAVATELMKLNKKIEGMPVNFSLDNPISEDKEIITFKDLLEDESILMEILKDQKIIQKCKELINAPDLLTNRERQVMCLLYFEEEVYTLEEVGTKLGIKRQTVHESKNNALKKLKRNLPKELPFLNHSF